MAATYTYLSERLCANRMYVPQDDFYRKQNTEKEESKAKEKRTSICVLTFRRAFKFLLLPKLPFSLTRVVYPALQMLEPVWGESVQELSHG